MVYVSAHAPIAGRVIYRDATGAVPGDGVGPHTDYLSRFPYLGKPH